MLGHRELTVDDYLEILRRRYWILLLLAALGATGAYLYSRTLPNEYLSRTLVLVQQAKVGSHFVTPVVSEQINERLQIMQEQTLSAANLQPIIERYQLFKKEFPDATMTERVKRLRAAVAVTPVQPMIQTPWSGVPGFSIRVTLNNPRVAQQVCSEITSMFLDQNARWRSQVAQDTTNFLSKQIDDAKHSLDQQDAQLTAFKVRYLGKLPDQAQTNMHMLASYNSQLGAVTESLNRTQQDKVYLESQLAQQTASWKATRSGSNLLTLEEQLATLRNKLVTMRAQYTDDYPDVIRLKRDISHMQEKVDAAKAAEAKSPAKAAGDGPAYAEPQAIRDLRHQIAQYDDVILSKTKQQAALQKQIQVYEARVQMSPLIDQKFKELTRNYQTALDFYRQLLTKKAQAEMGADLERRQQGQDFSVIDPATLSSTPTSPKRALFAGGGAGAGLFLALGIALWLELRDKLIRTERDVEFYLEATTLALVPALGKRDGVAGALPVPSSPPGGTEARVRTLDL